MLYRAAVVSNQIGRIGNATFQARYPADTHCVPVPDPKIIEQL
jgi:hypothetical protein